MVGQSTPNIANNIRVYKERFSHSSRVFIKEVGWLICSDDQAEQLEETKTLLNKNSW